MGINDSVYGGSYTRVDLLHGTALIIVQKRWSVTAICAYSITYGLSNSENDHGYKLYSSSSMDCSPRLVSLFSTAEEVRTTFILCLAWTQHGSIMCPSCNRRLLSESLFAAKVSSSPRLFHSLQQKRLALSPHRKPDTKLDCLPLQPYLLEKRPWFHWN